MKVRILTSALNDLAAGHEFYEEQGEGLGGYFFDSVFADIDALALYAGIHLKVFGYHRRLASRFPYAIYYRMDSDGLPVVHRVLDCRLDPLNTRAALERD
jgi:hypothetical protein